MECTEWSLLGSRIKHDGKKDLKNNKFLLIIPLRWNSSLNRLHMKCWNVLSNVGPEFGICRDQDKGRSGAPSIYFSMKGAGVRFGGRKGSIAFVWNPNAVGCARQGWKLRDMGRANGEKSSLNKRRGTWEGIRMRRDSPLNLPRAREGCPFQQWLLLFLSLGVLTCCWWGLRAEIWGVGHDFFSPPLASETHIIVQSQSWKLLREVIWYLFLYNPCFAGTQDGIMAPCSFPSLYRQFRVSIPQKACIWSRFWAVAM